MTKMDNGINLVLSGGGVKGVAHIALLDKLVKWDIPVNAIAGTSAGAIVASLFAAGHDVHSMHTFFKVTPIFRMAYLTPRKPGFFDSSKYEKILNGFFPNTFEELDRPIYITVVNLQKGSVEYFNSGSLIKPLLASCAIPPIFSPVKIHNELYGDGGIIDNFPIAPFQRSDCPVLGSYVISPNQKNNKQLASILKISNHASSLLLHAANYAKLNRTQIPINFPLGDYGSFDTSSIDAIYKKAATFLDKNELNLLKQIRRFLPSVVKQ